ncbi:MAG: sugar transferase [Lachnospira sp.]|nr:sugar transferase [Lachnospira sp.]
MELRKWTELPEKMRTREVRRYYNILMKRSGWFKMKRVIDIVVSVGALIVLALPMLVIAIMIKRDSKGPVFFRQERVTQYGRIFNIYKFRTMVHNAPELGSQVTVNNDVRITKVGKVLRRYRFDEFPQLFNIIAGDMTLVGTRPEVKKYVKQYTPEMYATLLLPAGLTSWTSIAYKNEDKLLMDADNADETYVKEILPVKMKYNLESLRNFGLKIELKVLIETVLSGIRKK